MFMDPTNGMDFRSVAGLPTKFTQANGTITALTIDNAGNITMPYTSSLLCLTGSSAKLGIGTSAPQAQFHIIGATGTNTMKIESLITGSNQISWVHYGTTADWYIRSGLTTGSVFIQDSGGSLSLVVVLQLMFLEICFYQALHQNYV